jgi:hypothetical protein
LPAAVWLNDRRIVRCGVNQAQFPVLFARNGERDLVRSENRGDRELLHRGVVVSLKQQREIEDRITKLARETKAGSFASTLIC